MEDILYCKNLYEPIEGDAAKPKEKSDKDWQILNWKTEACEIAWYPLHCLQAFSPWPGLTERRERRKLIDRPKTSPLDRLARLID
jgi:hypothetical protein